MKPNTTLAELERRAFLAASPEQPVLAELCDLQDWADGIDAHIEDACDDAYDKGYAEGLGAEAGEMIDALRLEVNQLKEKHQALLADLRLVQSWIAGDQCKTAAGRKEAVYAINNIVAMRR